MLLALHRISLSKSSIRGSPSAEGALRWDQVGGDDDDGEESRGVRVWEDARSRVHRLVRGQGAG